MAGFRTMTDSMVETMNLFMDTRVPYHSVKPPDYYEKKNALKRILVWWIKTGHEANGIKQRYVLISDSYSAAAPLKEWHNDIGGNLSSSRHGHSLKWHPHTPSLIVSTFSVFSSLLRVVPNHTTFQPWHEKKEFPYFSLILTFTNIVYFCGFCHELLAFIAIIFIAFFHMIIHPSYPPICFVFVFHLIFFFSSACSPASTLLQSVFQYLLLSNQVNGNCRVSRKLNVDL